MITAQQRTLLLTKTTDLFEGDAAAATQWLTSPHQAMGGISPQAYAVDAASLQDVLDLIGRLEHGVFS